MKWTNNPGSISNGGGQLCRKSPALKYVQAETMRSSLQSKSCSLWNPVLKLLATGYCKCMDLNKGFKISPSVTLATLQVFSGHVQPILTILCTDQEHLYHCRNVHWIAVLGNQRLKLHSLASHDNNNNNNLHELSHNRRS